MSVPTVTPVHSNPRRKKTWTYEQAESKKQQAERFTREVLEDDDHADEIAAMSVEDYAAEREVELVVDPEQGAAMKKKSGARPSQAGSDEPRENPAVVALQTATKAIEQQNKLAGQVRDLQNELDDRDKLLDSIVDILEDDDADFRASDRPASLPRTRLLSTKFNTLHCFRVHLQLGWSSPSVHCHLLKSA